VVGIEVNREQSLTEYSEHTNADLQKIVTERTNEVIEYS